MGNQQKVTARSLTNVAPDGIAANATLRGAGVSASMIATRCRPGGTWQRLLPGVVMLERGAPTRRQLLCAAVALAGPQAIITGADALQAYGVELPTTGAVRLLLPTARRLLPQAFLSVERTSRVPGPIICDGLPFAPPARAALDIARTATDPARLRKILALVTQHGLCTAEELHHELDAGNQRGSSAVRSALGHFDAAVATLLHGRAHRLLRHVPIPAPRWNVTVYDRRRRPIGYADAWWDEIGMAWQLDTEQPPTPTGPGSHIALTAAGVIVVRTPAAALNDAANSTVGRARLIRELTSAFLAGARRPRPPLLFGDPSMLSSA